VSTAPTAQPTPDNTPFYKLVKNYRLALRGIMETAGVPSHRAWGTEYTHEQLIEAATEAVQKLAGASAPAKEADIGV
jgi:hypothetical protein